jgi:DNA repair protein RecO (recombination protein O)
MSHIVRTPAIVLRYSEIFNTSRIVQWLTQDHGRVTTLIKGSQRVKSQYIGQYDLFYTCDLLFYTSDRRDLHPAKECSPENTRMALRSDWRAAACASYFCDVLYRVCPPHAPHPELYHLLEHALDDLCANGGTKSMLFAFDLHILDALGFRPRFRHCAVCERPASIDHDQFFGIGKGGVLCKKCQHHESHHAHRITQGSLHLLTQWQDAELHDIRNDQLDKKQENEVHQLLGTFMQYHLDNEFKSRDIALSILHRRDPATVRV